MHRARDPELGRDVAIKLLLASGSSSRDETRAGVGSAARMLREAQALARIEHPNVVRVFDVGTHPDEHGDDAVYLVAAQARGAVMSDQ